MKKKKEKSEVFVLFSFLLFSHDLHLSDEIIFNIVCSVSVFTAVLHRHKAPDE